MKSWSRAFVPGVRAIALALAVTGSALADEATNLADALRPDVVKAAFRTATEGQSARPGLLNAAFIAAEDRYFLEEFPARSTLTATIAQWYPPNGDDRSIKRHLRELQVSVGLANALTHDEILAWYMAGIYLGRGCYGVEAASIAYFGMMPDQLSLEEMALLAALPKAPAMFDPAREPEKALNRRNFVLSEMAKAGLAMDTVAREAAEKPLLVIEPPQTCND
jgi:membrane carboxypeptidase/penicillin-binding protein